MKKPKHRYAEGGGPIVSREDPATAPPFLKRQQEKEDAAAEKAKPKPSIMERFSSRAQKSRVDKAVGGYKRGGLVGRGDGCAVRGKTKGAVR